jgi:hypothetical protein
VIILNDGLVFFLIFLVLTSVSAIIQFLFCHFGRHLILRLLPIIVITPVWFICVLGFWNLVDLPQTTTLVDGGFIEIYDSNVIAVAGTPVVFGLLLAWSINLILQKEKAKNNEDVTSELTQKNKGNE